MIIKLFYSSFQCHVHNNYSNCTVNARPNCSELFLVYLSVIEGTLEEVKDIAEKFNDFLTSFCTTKDFQEYIRFSLTIKLKNSLGLRNCFLPLYLEPSQFKKYVFNNFSF